MATLSGCQWDPPHDNPLDHGSNAYHYPFGSLTVQVQTLNWQPVAAATVLLPELGQFAVSDDSGLVHFNEIPTGTWWAVAYREISGRAVYARDSAQVTIVVKNDSELSLQLDALPEFISTYAVSVSSADSANQPDPDYIIRLKATVLDPDGITHLARVEAFLIDTLRNYYLTLDLQYSTNPDSAFWWKDIPANSFPNQSTDNALFLPFTFRAYDFAGKASPPRTAFVARVLHGVPGIQDPLQDFLPHLEWNYTYWNELTDISTFNYLVRIYRESPELTEIYRRTIIPGESASGEHYVEVPLANGTYLWEVWVLDNFGNSSRSRRGILKIGPPL